LSLTRMGARVPQNEAPKKKKKKKQKRKGGKRAGKINKGPGPFRWGSLERRTEKLRKKRLEVSHRRCGGKLP